MLRFVVRLLGGLLIADLIYAAWPVIRPAIEGQITGHQALDTLLHDSALYPLVLAVIVLAILEHVGRGTLLLVIGAACIAVSFGLVHVSSIGQKVLGQRQVTAVEKLSQRCGLNLHTYEQDGKTYAQEPVPGEGLVRYAVTVGSDGVAQLKNAINGQPVSVPCSAVNGNGN